MLRARDTRAIWPRHCPQSVDSGGNRQGAGDNTTVWKALLREIPNPLQGAWGEGKLPGRHDLWAGIKPGKTTQRKFKRSHTGGTVMVHSWRSAWARRRLGTCKLGWGEGELGGLGCSQGHCHSSQHRQWRSNIRMERRWETGGIQCLTEMRRHQHSQWTNSTGCHQVYADTFCDFTIGTEHRKDSAQNDCTSLCSGCNPMRIEQKDLRMNQRNEVLIKMRASILFAAKVGKF